MNAFSRPLDVFADPEGAAATLAAYACTTAAEVTHADRQVVVFAVVLDPYPELAAAGYPSEKVRISVWRDGRITGVPAPDDRTWKHRNGGAFAELCLWYPADPRPLRWEWADGLLAYLLVVHRHVQAEEYSRRNAGRWPVEDTPHGTPRGATHPIRTWAMQAAAGEVR
jgi:hypothetical protein